MKYKWNHPALFDVLFKSGKKEIANKRDFTTRIEWWCTVRWWWETVTWHACYAVVKLRPVVVRWLGGGKFVRENEAKLDRVRKKVHGCKIVVKVLTRSNFASFTRIYLTPIHYRIQFHLENFFQIPFPAKPRTKSKRLISSNPNEIIVVNWTCYVARCGVDW